MLLSVRNLKKYYATQKAVDDISFDIEEGQIFGLLGPNGAGKSTLLRMLTGIFYADSGEILFNGEPFEQRKHAQFMGYMPEERGLYKKMKIGEQAMYLAQLRGLSKEQAERNLKMWFERLNMTTWWNKKVEDLSKGMAQKLQFVTTVAHNPKLLILDEPFSGLDPVNANVLKEEIYRLAKEGTTIIFSTHRMEQVEEICDHIVLVNLGRKVVDGKVDEIKQTYKENKFRLQIGNTSVTPPPFVYHPIMVDDSLEFTIDPSTNTNDILKYYIDQNVRIGAFQEVLPSLNEIFIRLVENTETARSFEK